MKKGPRSSKEIKIPSHGPWVYFSVFFITSCLLSYFKFALALKLIISFVGFVLPLCFVWLSRSSDPKRGPSFTQEVFPVPPGWLILIVGFAAIGFRFWKLETLFAWPNGDDATFGILTIEMVRHWDWKFFHGFAQHPPLTFWLGSWIYRMTHSPELSLWLPSAVLSAAAVPLSYWGARRFFSRSFSMMLAVLFAFSYWALLGGRGCLAPPAIYLLEGAAFYCLANFLVDRSKEGKRVKAMWVGLAAGSGFLVFPPCWSMVFCVLFAVMLFSCFSRKRSVEFWAFLGGSAVTSLPFLIAIWREGYGQHVLNVVFWKGDLAGQFSVLAGYWLMLFGATNDPTPYTPLQGGVLNPILASFFFLGVIEIFRGSWRPFAKWFWAVLVLFLAPGFLSWSLDGFRVVQIFPLLILITVLGLQTALRSFKPQKALGLALVLLTMSSGMDLYRLVRPYWDVSRHPEDLNAVGKAPDRYAAYRILEEVRERSGPGFFFTDLIEDTKDESLAMMTYPYNAAWDAPTGTAQWAGLFTNAHYLPFLSKRFPSAEWRFLPSKTPGEYSEHILGLIPMTTHVQADMRGWMGIHRFFMDLNTRMIGIRNGEFQRPILEDMVAFYPGMPNDPFLQSCFLEKLLFLYWTEKVYHPDDAWNHYETYSRTIQACLAKGYPDPALSEKVGKVLIMEGRLVEAEAQLKRTIRLSPRNPLALRDLKLIEAIKKGTVRVGPDGFELLPPAGGGR